MEFYTVLIICFKQKNYITFKVLSLCLVS